ncbi:MAG: hypothetical protein HKM93_22935 [Desulfobacteraceae bacterium]|nr:hypothetical protein [Desulfobacteraceae bacterium]
MPERDAGNLKLLGGRLCLDFVNTVDWRGTESPVEFLNCADDLLRWGVHSGMIAPAEADDLGRVIENKASVVGRVVARAIRLRETIYRLFAAVAAAAPHDPKDLAEVNRFLTANLQYLHIAASDGRFHWRRATLSTSLDGFLADIVKSTVDLLVSDDLNRVKMCADPRCAWLFLDVSKNNSRRWCDMKDCGNRAKVSRFYRKRKS